jgi:hypothetical protein
MVNEKNIGLFSKRGIGRYDCGIVVAENIISIPVLSFVVSSSSFSLSQDTAGNGRGGARPGAGRKRVTVPHRYAIGCRR